MPFAVGPPQELSNRIPLKANFDCRPQLQNQQAQRKEPMRHSARQTVQIRTLGVIPNWIWARELPKAKPPPEKQSLFQSSQKPLQRLIRQTHTRQSLWANASSPLHGGFRVVVSESYARFTPWRFSSSGEVWVFGCPRPFDNRLSFERILKQIKSGPTRTESDWFSRLL